MNNFLEVIRAIGSDIKNLQSNSLKIDKAYELFPTYATLQSQMATNIRDKHVDLGLDALIDTKLKNGGDPFVTRSQFRSSGTSTVRRAPMAYTLDRTTFPWTIWFDNGCGLQLPDHSTDENAYGYGASPNINNTEWVNYPTVGNIISASRGTLTIDAVKRTVNAFYWELSLKVINPINDIEGLNFDNAFLNQSDPFKTFHKTIIRVMYQLGIWSLKEIKELGVTDPNSTTDNL